MTSLLHAKLSYLFVLALLIVYVHFTLPEFNSVVAYQFGIDGFATNTMPIWQYVVIQSVVAVVSPMLFIGVLSLRNRVPDVLLNIPELVFWSKEENRDELHRRIAVSAWWLACVMVFFAIGVHYVLLLGHQMQPAYLPTRQLVALLMLFLFGLFVWWRVTMHAMRNTR